MKPVVKLLEQTEQNIRVAQQHLHPLFREKYSSGCYGNLFPPFFSPISGLTASQPESKIQTVDCSDSLQWHKVVQPKPNAYPSELACTSHRVIPKEKTRFPKTPHPTVGLKLSSTPDWVCIEQQSAESFVCEPRAINFDLEDSAVAVNQAADTPLPTSLEPQDLLTEFKAESNLSAIAELGSEDKYDKEGIGPPGLTQPHASVKVDSIQSGIPAKQRPRRMCTSLNVSYQEPSLKR